PAVQGRDSVANAPRREVLSPNFVMGPTKATNGTHQRYQRDPSHQAGLHSRRKKSGIDRSSAFDFTVSLTIRRHLDGGQPARPLGNKSSGMRDSLAPAFQ